MVNFLIGLFVGMVVGILVAALLGQTDADDYKDWEGEE